MKCLHYFLLIFFSESPRQSEGIVDIGFTCILAVESSIYSSPWEERVGGIEFGESRRISARGLVPAFRLSLVKGNMVSSKTTSREM
jgi:hypothetical protein